MFGLAKEWNELYYLDTSSEKSVSFLSKHHLVNKEKFWLNHCRFRHPSLRTLKIMFLSLFRKLHVRVSIVMYVNLSNTSIQPSPPIIIQEVQSSFI